MSALDDGTISTELVTDLGEIAHAREYLYNERGLSLPIQDAERDAGLSETDIWRFTEGRSPGG